ncbi:MAG TPA: hypothetical protein VGB51_00915 [Actinomycetota bacterium]
MADTRDGWDEHRRDQLKRWRSATPAQRLAALEELIGLARGAPRWKRDRDAGKVAPWRRYPR